MSSTNCPICGGNTTQGITPASGRWCIPNECDRLTQEDREALLQLPMKERLRSIDVMKGRISKEKELGVKESIDKLLDVLDDLDDLDKLWDEPTQPMGTLPSWARNMCTHQKRTVYNGNVYCADCGDALYPAP